MTCCHRLRRPDNTSNVAIVVLNRSTFFVQMLLVPDLQQSFAHNRFAALSVPHPAAQPHTPHSLSLAAPCLRGRRLTTLNRTTPGNLANLRSRRNIIRYLGCPIMIFSAASGSCDASLVPFLFTKGPSFRRHFFCTQFKELLAKMVDFYGY